MSRRSEVFTESRDASGRGTPGRELPGRRGCEKVGLLLGAAMLLGVCPGTWADVIFSGYTNPSSASNIRASTQIQLGVLIGDNRADGSLTINGGSVVSSKQGHVGHAAGVEGTATIAGNDSTWINSDYLRVGNNGDGILNITQGGEVHNDGWGVLGHGQNASGFVTVDGKGSAWSSTGFLLVGQAGKGTLEIKNGGTVTSSIGVLGDGPGARGTVTVDGAGSSWTAPGVRVGHNVGGIGELTLTDGGRLDLSDDLHIGFSSNSTGTVELDGGILDLNGNDVAFGLGTAAFNFTSGTLEHVGTFGASLDQRGGRLQMGHAPAVTTIAGDYTLAAAEDDVAPGGTLALRLLGDGGIAGSDFDRLVVNGTADLSGYLQVLLDPTYTPPTDGQWDVLIADVIEAENLSVISPDSGFVFDFEVLIGEGGSGDVLRLFLAPEPGSGMLVMVVWGVVLGAGRRGTRRPRHPRPHDGPGA